VTVALPVLFSKTKRKKEMSPVFEGIMRAQERRVPEPGFDHILVYFIGLPYVLQLKIFAGYPPNGI